MGEPGIEAHSVLKFPFLKRSVKGLPSGGPFACHTTYPTGIGDVEKMYGLKTQMIRKFRKNQKFFYLNILLCSSISWLGMKEIGRAHV